MFAKSFALILVPGAITLAAAGCDSCQRCRDPLTATDIQHEKMDHSRGKARNQPFNDMVDNAILSDMTVADFHFVAHTAEISGTGAARLNRMAPLLDTYGGTVRYETYMTDDKLVKQRLEHVREYLATTGCEMGRVEIKAMISGGHGMAADRAIIVDLKGTAAPNQQGSTTGALNLTSGPSGSK